MSRNTAYDFEYPPGLGFLRNVNGEREQATGLFHTPTPTRQVAGMQTYGIQGGQASMPRSVGLQERESYGFGNVESWAAPNRHTPSASHPQVQHLSSFNHSLRTRPSPPLPLPPSDPPFHTSAYPDRDAQLYRQTHPSPNQVAFSPAQNLPSSRSTLWWGELEPWMDEEYAKQVCGLMGWDPVNVKVPHPAPDTATGQQSNNAGYCFLTFPTASHAASVLAQINGGGTGTPVTMPNSSKPFVLNWASSVPTSLPAPSLYPAAAAPIPSSQQQFPKEYSIFVGDLAPETSNSDLVAVFRNPVLGLRNDREPKFIRPFLSCKSAKIMLDPVTGVSRGYGFVRFTDEADQQRALIEMHGLYCLSRPMRISPATAKFKPPNTVPALDLPQVQMPVNGNALEQQPQPVTIALPLPHSTQTKSVSAPIAAAASGSSLNSNSISSSGSGPSLVGSSSSNSLSSGTGSSTSISSSTFANATSEELMNLPNEVLAQIAQQYANGGSTAMKSISSNTYNQEPQVQGHGTAQESGAPRYTISEESWKHHAQARAILGNLIGPNGEQLTSTDPYNTTVFVGGLSPLISEETLRTFFAPFGDIHYVKVPVGKHCGFVQFVRKADAERAIEKMQGFPVGGSRIRLSWGRSQYKAAQAAAQAAQAAALQTHYNPPAPTTTMTQEQALQLLQKITMQQGYSATGISEGSGSEDATVGGFVNDNFVDDNRRSSLSVSRDEGPLPFEHYASMGFSTRPGPNVHDARQNHSNALSSFSPFSPDPNVYASSDHHKRDSSVLRSDVFPHPPRSFAPGFFPMALQTQNLQPNGLSGGNDKVSPTSGRPTASRYGSFLEGASQMSRAPGRPEGPVSRPSSGQMSSNSREDYSAHDNDLIHDLNGTLASLDLDPGSWKSPGTSSEDSTGSVQFTMAARSSQPASPPP